MQNEVAFCNCLEFHIIPDRENVLYFLAKNSMILVKFGQISKEQMMRKSATFANMFEMMRKNI